MIQLKHKTDCCGCHACAHRCPKSCIAMQADEEGFLYPQIDLDLCIDCGICEKVCPVIHQNEPRKPLAVYAAKNKDEEIRRQSSSGGVFTLLAEQIIAEGGVVFGARFNGAWEVVHDYTETREGLAAFRGSKYVQSRIGETYQQAEDFLKSGRKVLFSGTPCQIAGLKLYLRKAYDSLLTVDFICHGVPSPRVWELYRTELLDGTNKKQGDQTGVFTDIQFRDKTNGWQKYGLSATVKYTTGALEKLRIPMQNNAYMQGFLKDIYLRPACYACPSKSLKSGSDLTIADYWGIQRVLPAFDDDKGVSLVLMNTDLAAKGVSLVELEKKETAYQDGFLANPSLERSVSIPKQRAEFWKALDSMPNNQMITITNQICDQMKPSVVRRGVNLSKRIVKRILQLK